MTTNNEQEERVAKAVAGVRALREHLASQSSEFAAATLQTEQFCRTVRRALQQHRKRLKAEQKEIADRMDVSQSAVSKIETGEGDIGLKTVARYASALGLKPLVLFVPTAQQIFSQAAETAEGLLNERAAEESSSGYVRSPGRRFGTLVEASDKLQSVAVMVEDVQITALQEISDGIRKSTAKQLSNLFAQVIAERAKKQEMGEGA